jgi:general secretion pathway protein N
MTLWMRRLRAALPWLAIAVLSSAAVLLVLLPAAWVTPQFAKQTRGHVNLVDPAGSLWHGSATLMLAAGPDMSTATLLPGRIEWQTAFWPLFTGRVRMVMRQSEAMPDPVTVDATLRSATVSQGTIGVPASLLSGLGAPFNTLDLQGDVRLTWSDWRIFNQETFGQLTVTLNEVSSRVSVVKPLGSYRMLVQAQGTSSTLDL